MGEYFVSDLELEDIRQQSIEDGRAEGCDVCNGKASSDRRYKYCPNCGLKLPATEATDNQSLHCGRK